MWGVTELGEDEVRGGRCGCWGDSPALRVYVCVLVCLSKTCQSGWREEMTTNML